MSDFNDFDDTNYPRTEDSQFSDLLDRALSRRGFLNLGAAFGVTAFVGSVGADRPGGGSRSAEDGCG